MPLVRDRSESVFAEGTCVNYHVLGDVGVKPRVFRRSNLAEFMRQRRLRVLVCLLFVLMKGGLRAAPSGQRTGKGEVQQLLCLKA